MFDTETLYLLLPARDFLEYEKKRIGDFGCGVTTVPFKELNRLLCLCGQTRALDGLVEHDEFEDGIDLHSVVWEALVRIAEERMQSREERLLRQAAG